MITMKDIADIAGVSKASVSRVINKIPVTAEVQAKVEKVIAELNYRPNVIAQSLSNKKTNTIGLILPESLCLFSHVTDFIAKCVDCLSEQNKALITIKMATSESAFKDAIHNLVDRQCEGIIYYHSPVMDSVFHDDKIALMISQIDIPLAMINYSGDQSFKNVFWFDNAKLSALATEHLFELGHRNIAYLSAPLSEKTANERWFGYIETLKKYALDVPDAPILESTRTVDGGYHACKALLSAKTPFTSVICFNDLMALGAMIAFNEHGLKVPDDISIVGIDNSAISTAIKPVLTSVAMPIEAIINQAIDYLLADAKSVNIQNEFYGYISLGETTQRIDHAIN